MLPCPARPKPHTGPTAPQNRPALWRNKSAFQIRLLTRSACGHVVFLTLRVCERRLCGGPLLGATKKPANGLAKACSRSRTVQPNQEAKGWRRFLIATVDKSPDLRIIFKTPPWKQESSKQGPEAETERLNAALFRIRPNNGAITSSHLRPCRSINL